MCSYFLCLIQFKIYLYMYVMFFCQCPGEIEAAHPFIPGKGCFVSRNKLEILKFQSTQVESMQCGCQNWPFHVSLATRVSQVNPKLMRSIRVWQWRWMISKAKKHKKKKHLEITGRSLQKRMAMSKEENTVRELIKKSMKIPGEF